MNFKKPKFWDYKKPNFIAYLLFPITFLLTLNNFLLKIYPKKKFNEIKTICVGNIYLGGTGGAVDLILYGLILMIICIFRPDGLISFVPKDILERKKHR